jgi:hypothetical protein
MNHVHSLETMLKYPRLTTSLTSKRAHLIRARERRVFAEEIWSELEYPDHVNLPWRTLDENGQFRDATPEETETMRAYNAAYSIDD